MLLPREDHYDPIVSFCYVPCTSMELICCASKGAPLASRASVDVLRVPAGSTSDTIPQIHKIMEFCSLLTLAGSALAKGGNMNLF